MFGSDLPTAANIPPVASNQPRFYTYHSPTTSSSSPVASSSPSTSPSTRAIDYSGSWGRVMPLPLFQPARFIATHLLARYEPEPEVVEPIVRASLKRKLKKDVNYKPMMAATSCKRRRPNKPTHETLAFAGLVRDRALRIQVIAKPRQQESIITYDDYYYLKHLGLIAQDHDAENVRLDFEIISGIRGSALFSIRVRSYKLFLHVWV